MPVVNKVGLAADVPVGVPLIGSNNLVTVSNITSSSAAAGFPITNVANPSTNLKWVGGILTGDEFITVNGLLNRTVSYLAIAKHNLGSQAIPVSVETSDPANILLHFDGPDASTIITDANTIGSVHAWTANGSAQLDETQSRFGGSSLIMVNANDSFTKALLHCDGADASTTFTDSNAGGSAHTWTANGNAQVDTADFKFGGASLLSDGTGDFVSTPDSVDFTLGSGDFTIDVWFKCVETTAINKNIAGQTDAGDTAAGSAWRITRDITTNFISFRLSNGSAYTVVTGTTQFTNLINPGWHHVAAVRTGNTLKLFIDGIQEGGDVAFTGSVLDSTQPLNVGNRDATGGSWNGWIDEFRLSVGVARWTANFTPPVGAYSPAGDFVSIPDSSAFTFGSSDFTFDCWFNFTGVGGNTLMVAGQANNSLTISTRSFTIARLATNQMTVSVVGGSVAADEIGRAHV